MWITSGLKSGSMIDLAVCVCVCVRALACACVYACVYACVFGCMPAYICSIYRLCNC